MKAIVIHAYGASNQLRLEDVPRPEVAPDQALVKILVAGVNPVDWKIREGHLRGERPDQFPFTLGQDFSGSVVEVGAEVNDLAAGDEVFGFARGSYAEYAAIPRDLFARRPTSVDFNVAAALPTASLTAYQLVTDVAQLAPNQRVLIHGAAGGVGAFATQLALWRGARVIATASRPDHPYLQGLGVETAIDYHAQRFEDLVRDVDVAIDLVGRDTRNTLARTYPLLRRDGLIVTTVGPLDLAELKRRGLRGKQFLMQPNGRQLGEIAELVDRGILRPRVLQVLTLAEARKAQDLNQSGRSHGKIVLRVG